MEYLRCLTSICGFAHKEEEVAVVPESLEQIMSQMEFYFSPSNVEKDSFMKNQISLRDDRFVPVSIFMTFNKIKELNVTEEEVLEACSFSMKLDSDKELRMIRSKLPFVPDPRRKYKTIHVEGLDKDETIASLSKCFGALFPKQVMYIEMRRKSLSPKEKVFTGNANIELATEEIARIAVQKGIQYKGNLIMPVLYSDFELTLKTKGKKK